MGESFIELEVVAQLKMLCVAQMISMWARMQPISGIRQVPTKPAKKWRISFHPYTGRDKLGRWVHRVTGICELQRLIGGHNSLQAW